MSRSSLRPSALAALLVTAVLVLAGCGSSSSSSASAGSSSTTWTFTDDLGKTVTLDHRPTRVAGLDEQVVSLLRYGVEPVATWGWLPAAQDPRFAGLDTSGIAQLGKTYGEIDLEKLIDAKPDLIVADVYPTDEKGTIDTKQPDYGFKNLTQEKQVAKIAPIVTIVMGGKGADVLKSTTKLARALGVSSSKISAAKSEFTAASKDLSAAAASSGVTVTPLYADQDGVYVAKSQDDPSLQLYSTLGVKFFAPTPKGYYWGVYSWENASQVGGDVTLLSTTGGYDRAELLQQAGYAALPMAKAGQIHPWTAAGLDYLSQAKYMEQLAGYLEESKVVS